MPPKVKPTLLTVNDAIEAIRQAKANGTLPINIQMDQKLIAKLGDKLRDRGVSGIHLTRDPDADKGIWAYTKG